VRERGSTISTPRGEQGWVDRLHSPGLDDIRVDLCSLSKAVRDIFIQVMKAQNDEHW